MPHVIIKLWPGKSEQDKARLSEAIVNDLKQIMNSGDAAISVGFEEVDSQDWPEKVYKPDIRDKWDTLYKKPGYDPFK